MGIFSNDTGNLSTSRDASVVTARPTTPGPIFKPSPPDSLTAGSQINQAAEWGYANNTVTRGKYGNPVFTSGSQLALAQVGAPWPDLIDGGVKGFTAFRPNSFREIFAMKVLGNYGMNSSRTNFGFRHQEYPAGDDYWGGNIAGYPGAVPSARRPMWNNLLAIVYALRVSNPTAGGSLNGTTTPNNYNSNSYDNPAQYIPGGNASLVFKGENVT